MQIAHDALHTDSKTVSDSVYRHILIGYTFNNRPSPMLSLFQIARDTLHIDSKTVSDSVFNIDTSPQGTLSITGPH